MVGMTAKYIRSLVLLISVGVLGACSGSGAEPSPYEEVDTMENVTIELEKEVYDSEGDTFILTTINGSEDEISYGIAFTMEIQQDGEWYAVEPNEEVAFILIAHSLEPGNEAEEELDMEYYEPIEEGNYRVVREIEGEILTAEFKVE